MRVILTTASVLAVAALLGACGTEKISVPKSDPVHQGAVLFNQRCGGCHTLSYAATQGSAANVRTALINNGPNFNVRCERPATRVLYAIENGGFSGAIMPQNVVVGQDARLVADFVSKYAGRQAQQIPGQTPCAQQSVGTLPPPGQSATQATSSATTSSSSAAPPGTSKPSSGNASAASQNHNSGNKNKK
jgi:mono/diheme cytochrome c family protein